MKKVNYITKKVEQNVSAINSTKSQKKTLKKTALSRSWVSALFKKFQARYGNKWTSNYDGIIEFAIDEWAEGLGQLNGQQLNNGLETWNSDWPPSLPEFVNTCLGKNKNEYGLEYVPEYHRKTTKKLLESDSSKKKRIETGKTHMSKIKGLLNKRR